MNLVSISKIETIHLILLTKQLTLVQFHQKNFPYYLKSYSKKISSLGYSSFVYTTKHKYKSYNELTKMYFIIFLVTLTNVYVRFIFFSFVLYIPKLSYMFSVPRICNVSHVRKKKLVHGMWRTM